MTGRHFTFQGASLGRFNRIVLLLAQALRCAAVDACQYTREIGPGVIVIEEQADVKISDCSRISRDFAYCG